MSAVAAAAVLIAAGGEKKPTIVLPEWLDALKSLQSDVREIGARWAAQLDRVKTTDKLLSIESPQRQLQWFDRSVRGQTIAWVLSFHTLDYDVSDGAQFVEHSNQSYADLESTARNVRCYIDDDVAEKLRETASGTLLLCVGELVDFHALHKFVSLSVRATEIHVSKSDVKAWIADQQK